MDTEKKQRFAVALTYVKKLTSGGVASSTKLFISNGTKEDVVERAKRFFADMEDIGFDLVDVLSLDVDEGRDK